MSSLKKLQDYLQKITGKKLENMESFRKYWEFTTLEDVAKKTLMPVPLHENLSNEQIKDIIINLFDHKEFEIGWYIDYLKVNTGIINISDYIYYPESVGIAYNASMNQIAERIIEDRK